MHVAPDHRVTERIVLALQPYELLWPQVRRLCIEAGIVSPRWGETHVKLTYKGKTLQQPTPDEPGGPVLGVNGLAFNGVKPFSTLSIPIAARECGLPLPDVVCPGEA